MKYGFAKANQRRAIEGARTDARLAEWMAENGGSVLAAAYALRIPQSTADKSWKRIRRQLGAQAV